MNNKILKIGVVMDPIKRIRIQTDSSFGILLAAQQRNLECYYMEPQDVWLQDGIAWGRMRSITVMENGEHWFDFGEEYKKPLHELDIVFMRKDPPFDIDYLHLTYLLDMAELQGALVVNRAASVRNANEKLFAARFPRCCPKTLVTARADLLKEFIREQKKTVLKPINDMAGNSVFLVTENDLNTGVIIETLTHNGRRNIMAQQFIPEVAEGDKRILMIDGEPISTVILRRPVSGDFRATVARGGSWIPKELTEHDRWICSQIGPTLREQGLFFVGLDVIGNYITEINVTCPTGARLLDVNLGMRICDQVLSTAIDKFMKKSKN